jgi:hypothetical protein
MWFIKVIAGTTLVYYAIAIVVLVIVTDLGRTIICWFGAISRTITFEVFAHAMRFVEVMTGAAIINCSIAVIVFAIAANLGHTVIRWFGAYALVIALEVFAHAVRLVEIVTRTTVIDHTVAIVVFAIAADLCFWSDFTQTVTPVISTIAFFDANLYTVFALADTLSFGICTVTFADLSTLTCTIGVIFVGFAIAIVIFTVAARCLGLFVISRSGAIALVIALG